MARMNDDELRAITDSEMRQAIGYWGGKLAGQRQKAEYYYLGLPKGDLSPPEVEGRSAVVSTDVRNTIESMLPALMSKFVAGENVVEFEPTQQDDEQKAQTVTDYINYLFFKKNNGHAITYTWFKDALLQKNGIVKVWWDTRVEETREEYKGLDDVELAQIMDDEEVEVTEHTAYPDEEDQEQRQQALQQLSQQYQQAVAAAQQNPQAMQGAQQIQAQAQHIQSLPPKKLHDITANRSKKGGKLTIDNVPPEEFLISRKAKSIATASFVGHRVMRTVSELNSMGYDTKNLSSDDTAATLNAERVERLSWDDEQAYLNEESTTMDESQRIVWVTECYLRVDYDGDGIAELRKVTRAGNTILDNEVVDIAPFIDITPIRMPHKFWGMSIADVAMESQRIKTSLLRAHLDNLYLGVNGRYYAVEGQVNLDDLLTSRPGGVVRVKNPQAAGRLDQGAGDQRGTMEAIAYMEDFLENSTGWTRYSQGTDSNSLNKTATGVNIITNRSDMRLDLIARNFAEGFTELFKMMLKLVCQNQDKEQVTRIGGQWVNIDPREWRNQFDVNISVGLGTGNKDQQAAHLMNLMAVQEKAFPLGVATPENIYEAAKELAKMNGFKFGDKFFTDPAKQPPKPPQPDPEMVKAQAQQQSDQAKLQAQQQIEQMKLQYQQQCDAQAAQLEQFKMQMQQQIEQARLESAERIAQYHAQMDTDRALKLAETNGEYMLMAKNMDATLKHEATVTDAHVQLTKVHAENMRTQSLDNQQVD